MDEPRGVGRPAYQPTEAGKQIVRVLKANGIGERTIAAELGIMQRDKNYTGSRRVAGLSARAGLSAATEATAGGGFGRT